jgi:hypothetical protein
MSSTPVREAFRQAWGQYAPQVPYVDAINTHPGPLPPIFGSLAFEVSSRGDVTMGSHPWVVEAGQVLVSFFGQSGVGDAAMVEAALTAMRLLRVVDFGPDLTLLTMVGPNDAAAEGEGAFFETQVTVAYEWQGREART